MRDDGVRDGGDRRSEGSHPPVPEQRGSAGPPPQFAPGPQAVVTPAKRSIAAAATAQVSGTAPERQEDGVATPAPVPARPPRTLFARARTWLLIGGGAIGALLVVGLGLLIAVYVLASSGSDAPPLPRRRRAVER